MSDELLTQDQPAHENNDQGVENTPENKQTQNDPHARAFAALSRRERDLVAREQQLKEREAALQAPKEEKGPQQYTPQQLRVLGKTDPNKLLEIAGIDMDYITNVSLDGKPPEYVELYEQLEQANQRIEELVGRLDGDKKSQEEQQREAAIHNYKQGIAQVVEADQETYKLVNKAGANGIETVFALIEYDYNQQEQSGVANPQALSVEEAAKQVEAHFANQAKEMAKLMGYTVPEDTTPPEDKQPAQTSQTLSNEMSTTRETSTPPKLESHDDFFKRKYPRK